MAITDKDIAEFRKLKDEGMISAVGEYTPEEFWTALDEIENLRSVLIDLLNQIESCDGTSQLDIERAKSIIG